MHGETNRGAEDSVPRRFVWVDRERIDPADETFRVRRSWADEVIASIRARGVRSPLLVQPRGDTYRLISGVGRYLHSGDRELPCFELPAELRDEEVWDELLREENRWNTVELARVLNRVADLPDFDAPRVARETLPRVGLRPSRELLDAHLELAELPEAALHLVERSGLSLRQARVLRRFDEGALVRLVDETARLRFTRSELARVLESLEESAHRDEVPVLEVLEAELGGAPDKRRALAALEERRRPQLAEFRRRLANAVQALKFTDPVRIRWDETLERPGFRLEVDVADEDALDRFRGEFDNNLAPLRRLFDVL